jgi:hypothetical protein
MTATRSLTACICPSEVAGLLRDAGIAGTLLALAEKKGRRKSRPDWISIWPGVDRDHQRAGEIMETHLWLPDDIRFAISAHHQVMMQGHSQPLVATAAVANRLSNELGLCVIPKVGQELDEMVGSEADCVRAIASAHEHSNL